MTNSINSSMRLYAETVRAAGSLRTEHRVPVGCALFPGELVRPPRAWVARQYDLQRWTEMPRGGHFAAMEAPELLVADVRAFFAQLR